MEQVAHPDALAGKTLGHYRCEQALTQGGLANVYRARDERLERPVAVKVAALAVAQDQFREEARLTATLDHPNILPVYDVGAQEGLAYLVMHYASGGSLEDRLHTASNNGRLSLEEVAYYLDQAAAALDYTHTRGIIHAHLKPSNLLLRERWLMLGDFGHVQRAGKNGLAASPHVGGASGYRAPEQQRGAQVGPSADLYALGSILHRMLWGRLPGSAPSGRWPSEPPQKAQPLQPLAGLTAQQIQAVEALIRKAIAERPEDRYPSAGEMASEFRAIIITPGKKSSVAPGAPEELPIICPSCGFLNKPQARFCRNDGTRLPVLCPRCGAENRSDARFCHNDGTELARICPTCGTVNPWQAKVCQKDQTLLAHVCPVCGFENPLRARYCERDGAALQQ